MSEQASRTFTNKSLTLVVKDTGDTLCVEWSGKSTAREPGRFVGPILQATVVQAGQKGRPVVFDFRAIEYMNSSTITPVIRVLDEAKRSNVHVEVLYSAKQKWQELSFSALQIFTGEGSPISIRGA